MLGGRGLQGLSEWAEHGEKGDGEGDPRNDLYHSLAGFPLIGEIRSGHGIHDVITCGAQIYFND